MSAVLSDALPRQLIPKPQITAETIFHPLAKLEYKQLSQDERVSLREDIPAVLLNKHVYVGYYLFTGEATKLNGRLWKYSLIDGSWGILSTPEGAVSGYCLSVCSDKLVLISDNLNNVWIRQREEWKRKNIQSLSGHRTVSATSYKNILFVMTRNQSELYLTSVNCDCDKTDWSQPIAGPAVESCSQVNIISYDSFLFAMNGSNNVQFKLFKARITLNADVCEIGKWEELDLAGNYIYGSKFFTVFGNRLIIVTASNNDFPKLYTPFTDFKHKSSLVEFDELGVKYRSIRAVFGLEQSLLVIGEESSARSTTVVKFTSKVDAYDCNSHFTTNSFKRLEVVAKIPVLTGDYFRDSQLSDIQKFAGFSPFEYCDAFSTAAIVTQYMECWLRGFNKSTCKGSDSLIAPPSWGMFLKSLKIAKLDALGEEIKKCLETTHEVVEVEVKEASGIEEMRKLCVQLKRMYDQSNTEEATDLGMTQQFKEDIYCQCSTMCRKVESEIKQLKTDKEQLEKQLEQLKQENLSLKIELSKIDETPPSKRPHIDDSEGSTFVSKPTLKELMRMIKGVAPSWEDLGVDLGFNVEDLKQIKVDNPGDSKSCLRVLLSKWLNHIDPEPSWEAIVEAVEVALEKPDLAQKLRTYCAL